MPHRRATQEAPLVQTSEIFLSTTDQLLHVSPLHALVSGVGVDALVSECLAPVNISVDSECVSSVAAVLHPLTAQTHLVVVVREMI